MQTSKSMPQSENIKRGNVPSSLPSPICTNSSSNVSCESCRRGDILEPRWGGVWCDETMARGDEDDLFRCPLSMLPSRAVAGLPKRKNATTRRIRATAIQNYRCIRAINDSVSRSDATRTYNEKVNPADPDGGRNRGAVRRERFAFSN